MRTSKLVIVAGVVGLAVGGISLLRHSPPNKAQDLEVQGSNSSDAAAPKLALSEVSAPQAIVVAVPASEPNKLISNQAEVRRDSGPTPKSSIFEKMQFKKKIFKSPEEERELLRLAKDPESFKYGSAYLQNEKNWSTAEFEEEQNAMLDLFKMGFEQQTSEAYAQALIVIADNRIEEKNLSIDQRNVLAGVQAELMFHLLSADSSYSQAVQQAAQGPVHVELLKNVNLQLDANYQDSLSEKADRDKIVAAGEPVSI
jgi:hypothetical protein